MTVNDLLREAESIDLGANGQIKLPVSEDELKRLQQSASMIRAAQVENIVVKQVGCLNEATELGQIFRYLSRVLSDRKATVGLYGLSQHEISRERNPLVGLGVPTDDKVSQQLNTFFLGSRIALFKT